MNYKMYCIINMEVFNPIENYIGKVASQAGHAFVNMTNYMGHNEFIDYFESNGLEKKITVKIDTTEKLVKLYEKYKDDYTSCLITDVGLTCFDGKRTITCMGILLPEEHDLKDIKRLRLL